MDEMEERGLGPVYLVGEKGEVCLETISIHEKRDEKFPIMVRT